MTTNEAAEVATIFAFADVFEEFHNKLRGADMGTAAICLVRVVMLHPEWAQAVVAAYDAQAPVPDLSPTFLSRVPVSAITELPADGD